LNGDRQRRLTSLPISLGLSLYFVLEVASYAFVVFMDQFWVLQDHIISDSRVCGMDSNIDSVLDGFHETIPGFNFSSFTRKNIILPKAQHVLVHVLFGKIV
jgi:hypothetical protein